MPIPKVSAARYRCWPSPSSPCLVEIVAGFIFNSMALTPERIKELLSDLPHLAHITVEVHAVPE